MKKKKKSEKKKKRGSLRLQLFIIIFAVGMIPCLILHFGILQTYESRAVEVKADEVRTQMRALSNHLLQEDYFDNTDQELINAELMEFSTLFNGRLLVIDENLKVVRDTYSMADGKTIVSKDVVACLKYGNRSSSVTYDKKDGFIDIVTPIIDTSAQDNGDVAGNTTEASDSDTAVSGVMLASVSTETISATMLILSRKAMLLELIILLLVFILSLFLSTELMKPFERLSLQISAVKAGFSNDPVQPGRYKETAHIADAFNQVLGRMNALDESRQEFVSNVSHELKTPMTSMKVLADALVTQPDAPIEMYRDFMVDIDEEIDRENKIISELLSLVRMDQKQAATLEISSVNINALVEKTLKQIRPLAQKRDIELTMVSEREVTAEVDETKMSMILINLIENAVKYNKDHGSVRVTVNADHQNFTVSVADTGIGIPEESVGRIYERFYRVDKSRSREVGGTGLGLSITKSAILLHHGKIDVNSKVGEGTTFFVTIPLNYIEHPTLMSGGTGADVSVRKKSTAGMEFFHDRNLFERNIFEKKGRNLTRTDAQETERTSSGEKASSGEKTSSGGKKDRKQAGRGGRRGGSI